MVMEAKDEEQLIKLLINTLNKGLGEIRRRIDSTRGYKGKLSSDRSLLVLLCVVESTESSFWEPTLIAINVHDINKTTELDYSKFCRTIYSDVDLSGMVIEFSDDNKTVFIGAPESHNGTGAVFVYTLDGGRVNYRQKITPTNGCPGGSFGLSIGTIKGGVDLLICALTENLTGRAYYYKLSGEPTENKLYEFVITYDIHKPSFFSLMTP